MLLKDSLFQAILTVCSKKGEGDSIDLMGNADSIWTKISAILIAELLLRIYDRAPHLYLHYQYRVLNF